MGESGAHAAHGLLLFSMLVIPASGHLISTSAGQGFSFFEPFEVPTLFAKSELARNIATVMHACLAYGLIAVIAIHSGAAPKHQFIDRHGTLKRML